MSPRSGGCRAGLARVVFAAWPAGGDSHGVRNVTASRTPHGCTLSVRARPATCRPEASTPVGTRWSTIVFEEGRTPRGASRLSGTRAGGCACRLRTTLTGRRYESWPCKSNPVRLGSCVSRALARREIAGFRPGFWPQGQLRHLSSLWNVGGLRRRRADGAVGSRLGCDQRVGSCC
jgi:hypothetical protein